MALGEGYKLDWDGSDRVSVVFTGKAVISVEFGQIAVGEYVEEVAYVAPDPEAEPPVEEVEYVAPKPDADGMILHWNRQPYGLIVDGTVGFFNMYTGPNGEKTDVRILPFTD